LCVPSFELGERDCRASILHNNAANVLFNMNLADDALEHYVQVQGLGFRV
jgi:hypothetical protein